MRKMKHGHTAGEFGQRFNVWQINPCRTPSERFGHPAPFPLTLARDHIISWSAVGDVVLDPFMGSGTVGVACLNTNRRFIGIEKEEKYFAIAKDRIEKAISTPKQGELL
jgi:site-specific DNA-methyltransferase (adenine-specific)